jgi:hypothetical protein
MLSTKHLVTTQSGANTPTAAAGMQALTLLEHTPPQQNLLCKRSPLCLRPNKMCSMFQSPHSPCPLQSPWLKVQLPFLYRNSVTQGQKSLEVWLHRRIRPRAHFKMASSNPGRNLKAPVLFHHDCVDVEDNLSLPFREFTSGRSCCSTPLTHSAST